VEIVFDLLSTLADVRETGGGIETDAALVDLNHAPLTLLTDWLGER
jgi:hypothetical protein